jgi:hypothetical protein
MYVDPLEWARRRQAAVEHAARCVMHVCTGD